MVYGLWLSAAGLQANRYRQDLIANNLANVDTPGFKEDLAVFTERLTAAREPFGDSTLSHETFERMTGGTFVAPTVTSFAQGRMDVTNRPFDVALQGEGFFTVRDGDQVRYTRDGRFTVNAEGELVTIAGGHPVLGEGGTPILVPTNRISDVRFTEDGTVRVGEAAIGRLGLVDFEDKAQLRKIGGNLFAADADAVTKDAAATVHSGAVETSTVDPALTMVAMIEASRAYQLNAQLITMQDSMLDRAANAIGRVG